MIALHPHFYSGKSAHDFFTAYLEPPSKPVMRSYRDPGSLDQIFAAKQQTRTLRSLKVFAPTISHQIRALSKMWVRDWQSFGGSVYQYRNVHRLGQRSNFF